MKFPRAIGLSVARELNELLDQSVERLIFAGSLRRRAPEVGDVEVLFIPRVAKVRADLFSSNYVSLADRRLDDWIAQGRLSKRLNADGVATWGPKNKYAVHVASGCPVDFFTATADNWWNYLVCRTGPTESNVAICTAAKRKGWKWHPYGEGFTDARPAHRRRERAGCVRSRGATLPGTVGQGVALDPSRCWRTAKGTPTSLCRA